MHCLYDLLEDVEVLEIKNKKNVEVKGVEYNSRNVTPGDIFVCIKGYRTDGHQYFAEAVSHGAAAVVVEELQEDDTVPQVRVDNSRRALAALSCNLFGHPSRSMRVVGVTATNGKTTTAYMIDRIMEKHGLMTGLMGTVVYKMGRHVEPARLTTPESLDLQRSFARMQEEDVSHVTMEVSSGALQLSRVEGVDFDIVTLNNINKDHIDFHGSFERYFKSKSLLIRNAGKGARAVLNLDCPYAASLVEDTEAGVVTFGVESREGHLGCRNLDLSTGRARFTAEVLKPFSGEGKEYRPGEKIKLALAVPGYHSVYNSMVALTVGMLCGVPAETIKNALQGFRGVERRFELIFEDDFKILDDHFANSGNINMTLGTLQLMDSRKIRVVYAIRGSRGVTVNRENAEAIASWAPRIGLDEIVVTLSRSHVTEKDRVTEEEVEAFQEVMSRAGIKVRLFEELPDAIFSALSAVQPGDVIILAGAQGMDYGAGIALGLIRQWRPEIDHKRLFEPLENRVAGVT